jgi:DNA-binding transcriptional ArsR family regulator
MGKTLETKKRILSLLKKKEMTISELSRELGLSTATISQHLDEMRSIGAVEKMENEHFKKLKYYRPVGMVGTNFIKYVAGFFVILILASLAYLYLDHNTKPSTIAQVISTEPMVNATSSAVGQNSTTTSGASPSLSAFSCPMITYMLNGSISSYSGFSVYNISSSSGNTPDYVIKEGSTGMLHINEYVYDVLPNPGSLTTNRTHYAILQNLTSLNSSSKGINLTEVPPTYNAVNDTHINFTLTVSVNKSAPNATYWLRIDGPCGGGVSPVLLTVGSMPYNGTLPSGPIGIYG